MSELIDVTLKVKPEEAFRGRHDSGGSVEIISYEGRDIGGIEAYAIEHELVQIETRMERRYAERAFFFMGSDMAEDIVDGPPSPAIFLAKMQNWTTKIETLKQLQRKPVVFNEDELSPRLDESYEEFDPVVGGAYAIVNQKRELITGGFGLSFDGHLLALEGVRRSLVVASAEVLMHNTVYFGGRHTLHRVLSSPKWVK